MSSSSEKQSDPAMAKAEPSKEHAWLTKIVGDWTYEGSCMAGPDEPAQKFTGTERVRALGDLWVIGEGSGEMPGMGPATTMVTLGYNPQTKRFVGSWVGSMMTHMWVYDGWLDETEKILTLESEGPDFADPSKTATYRDVVEMASDDHRILRSQGQGPDGSWNEFMRCDYHRKK